MYGTFFLDTDTCSFWIFGVCVFGIRRWATVLGPMPVQLRPRKGRRPLPSRAQLLGDMNGDGDDSAVDAGAMAPDAAKAGLREVARRCALRGVTASQLSRGASIFSDTTDESDGEEEHKSLFELSVQAEA